MEKLLPLVTEAEQLLRSHEAYHWANWLADNVIPRIESYDSDGVTKLLSGYGGMGSFNDLFICPQNHHKIAEAYVKPVNEKLRKLSSDMWTLAKQIEGKAGL